MNDIEKAKKLLGREPTDRDEPFETIKGWEPEKETKEKKRRRDR